MKLLARLVAIAEKLDALGFRSAADIIDNVAVKVSAKKRAHHTANLCAICEDVFKDDISRGRVDFKVLNSAPIKSDEKCIHWGNKWNIEPGEDETVRFKVDYICDEEPGYCVLEDPETPPCDPAQPAPKEASMKRAWLGRYDRDDYEDLDDDEREFRMDVEYVVDAEGQKKTSKNRDRDVGQGEHIGEDALEFAEDILEEGFQIKVTSKEEGDIGIIVIEAAGKDEDGKNYKIRMTYEISVLGKLTHRQTLESPAEYDEPSFDSYASIADWAEEAQSALSS